MKRGIGLGLCCVLLLSSCAGMLERDYLVTSVHVENPPPQGDAAYRVETYPALMSALVSYVEEGMEEGVLRFPTTYEGNLTVDLEKARRQLLEEDPLGSYALDDLTFHTSKIIAYYETELTFTYKVDRESLPALPKATTQEALAQLLREAVDRGETSLAVYLTAYPEADDGFFSDALELALAPDPADGEGEPGLDDPEEIQLFLVELYPKTGRRRVAALDLRYAPAEDQPPEGEASTP